MSHFHFLKAGSAALALALAPLITASADPSGLYTKVTSPRGSNVSQQVVLGVNKSLIVELDTPATDVVIANPLIADAVVQTSKRIIFRGVGFGQTNALIFDRQGNQLLDLNIEVETDMAGLDALIARHVPAARVKIESVGGNVVMTGNVDNISQSEQVRKLVAAYLRANEETQIVNMLSVAAADQVMLEVRIVEMQRNTVKQLGISLSGGVGIGDFANLLGNQFTGIAEASTNVGFPIQGRALGGIDGSGTYQNYVGNQLQSQVTAALNALERIGVVRTLAEPNLVAMSGESAKFLAGGEFPVPVGQDNQGRITVEFKPFGVGLGFTPVVLSEGRISMKVSTEVSELTSQGAFQGQRSTVVDSNGNTISFEGVTLPGLTVRRAESTIELPSGGSIMMAGLIQSKDRQNLDQIPGLKKLPVLGALFQSRDFISEETELVVIVTPYLVTSTSKALLRTPADGFANASDAKTVFFGKLNEQYGRDGAPVKADKYRAPVGFIEE